MPQRSLLSFLFLFLVLYLSPEVRAQSVVVETQLDSTAILVGEQVRLRARVSCDAHAKVVFPQFAEGQLTPGVEVLSVSPIDTTWLNDKKRCELTCSYLLTSFDSALYQLNLTVEVNGKPYQSRNTLGLKVSNVAVDEQHPDQLRPAHPPTEAIFVWRPALLLWCALLWMLMAAAHQGEAAHTASRRGHRSYPLLAAGAREWGRGGNSEAAHHAPDRCSAHLHQRPLRFQRA